MASSCSKIIDESKELFFTKTMVTAMSATMTIIPKMLKLDTYNENNYHFLKFKIQISQNRNPFSPSHWQFLSSDGTYCAQNYDCDSKIYCF